MNWLSKRIPTLLGILILLGIVAGAGGWFLQRKSKVDEQVVPTKVQITNVQDNKFSVSWITQKPSTGKIMMGRVGEKLTQAVADERGDVESIIHQVTATELQPNTQYVFRIVSGSNQDEFDNNGSPYAVTTGPVIGNTPPSRNFYGQVKLAGGQTPEALVYLSLPNAAATSSLTTKDGNYAFTLSTIRTDDYQSYAKFDSVATIATLMIDDGNSETTASVSMANATPVPLITLGKNVSFLAPEANTVTPAVAEVVPVATTPSIFNVEPLDNSNEVNAGETKEVKLLNPATNGETLATLRPEFRGTGPRGVILSVAITGKTTINDVVEIGLDGAWNFSPETNLKVGSHTVTIGYIANDGTQKAIERTFLISDPGAADTVAFVSTPSASTKASILSSPSPREAMPATDGGVPVTGVIENTLLTIGAGVILVVAGLLFF